MQARNYVENDRTMTDNSQMKDTDILDIEYVKGSLGTMKLIHLALAGGVIIFGVIVLVFTHSRMTLDPDFRNPLCILAGCFAAVAILVSSTAHKAFFALVPVPGGIQGAIQIYQVFFLMRSAVIEGAALFSAVAGLVTANILPVGLLVLCTVLLAIQRPSQHEFTSVMKRCLNAAQTKEQRDLQDG
ncbi:MAG: hypothetical protein AAB393_18040, partial [Bacteroidota bacterium]